MTLTRNRQSPAPEQQLQRAIDYRAASASPRRRRHPERWVAFVAACLISVGFIFPLIWMLSTSLKPLDQTMEYPPRFIPRRIDWYTTPSGTTTPIPKNYVDVILHDKMDFPQYTRNTLWIAAMSIIGTVISSSLVAYGFARIRFKGRGALFGLMLSTMMIPFPVLMVPLFAIFRFMGDYTPIQMLGTLRPLWLPAFFGSAFNIFLLRQFYMTIPEELSEAARIDGCSELGIWWRIILPLSRPALAVVALFTFMGAWNNFLGPLIYLQDPSQYTLALGLQVFQSSHGGTEWNLLMAASLLILSPVIVLFFLAQKTFIQGIATTGMKG
ncbi:carbohydrate ABC transporter permease [Fontivita pretiosa]|uniref:carbohydrate ABC transporter permease n=1 Tax=Fontivita pretiosa TaxID=2989684 RepID=UPI003D177F85